MNTLNNILIVPGPDRCRFSSACSGDSPGQCGEGPPLPRCQLMLGTPLESWYVTIELLSLLSND